MSDVVHHIEWWTEDIEAAAPAFDWLFASLGWAAIRDPDWPAGRIWRHPGGTYVVLEQSPDVSGPHERTRAGTNHVAFRVEGRHLLDAMRAECVAHGWVEMFAERYPHAGGPDHTALFIENAQGFEVELVADAVTP